MRWKTSRTCELRDIFPTIIRYHLKQDTREYGITVPAIPSRHSNEYIVPNSEHFICPHCGAYWLEIEVLDPGSYHATQSRNCKEHGGDLLTTLAIPFEILPHDLQEEHFLTYLKEETCLV